MFDLNSRITPVWLRMSNHFLLYFCPVDFFEAAGVDATTNSLNEQ